MTIKNKNRKFNLYNTIKLSGDLTSRTCKSLQVSIMSTNDDISVFNQYISFKWDPILQPKLILRQLMELNETK